MSSNKQGTKKKSGKSSLKKPVLMVVVGLLAAALVAGGIWFFCRNAGDDTPAEPTTPSTQPNQSQTPAEDWMDPSQNQDPMEITDEMLAAYPILNRDSYTSQGDPSVDMALQAVTMAGSETTNAVFSVWYWQGFYDLMSELGYYASYYGLDASSPLESQSCTVAQVPMSWQQYLIQEGLNTWHRDMALALEAKANGMELSQENREMLDNLEASMDEVALQYGQADALSLLQSDFGFGVTLADYATYLETVLLSDQYYQAKSQELAPTAAEISTYYEEHQDTLKAQGVERSDMAASVTVRQILIKPEGSAMLAGTYSREQMDQAQAEAQTLLAQWKAGDATEDAFAELAKSHSQDTASRGNGGLYQDVVPDQLGNWFNEWSFDTARKTGDTAIVESNSGVHILYFVSAAEETHWYATVKETILQNRMNALVEELMAARPYEVDYEKLYISSTTLAAMDQ